MPTRSEEAKPTNETMTNATMTASLTPAVIRSLPRVQISSGARIPELDGARGVAVLSVVIAHYFGEVQHALFGFAFGWMGVSLFFVLSGFLIGSIILERKDDSNFLSVFYTRRALRILPVYFVMLTSTLGFIWFYGSAPWIDPPLSTSSYFTFTQNFVMAWRGEEGTVWLLPTWTLAVEEQFYLILPLLIMFIPARGLLPAIISGIAFCLLTRVLLYVAGADIPSRLLLFSNGHILLIGVLSAYIQQHVKVPVIILRLIPLASVAALTVLILTTHNHVFLAFMAPLFASYILLAVQGWAKLRFLRSRLLRSLGAISYCLYLVHQPVNGLLHGLILGERPDIATAPQILVTCFAVIVSISIAALSWFALEQPLLRLARRESYSSGADSRGQQKIAKAAFARPASFARDQLLRASISAERVSGRR
jgi:peptidoglycan/LPS O-acetylase OafA/YrhL